MMSIGFPVYGTWIEGVSRWGLGFCIEVILGVKNKCDAKASSEGWAWYWLS